MGKVLKFRLFVFFALVVFAFFWGALSVSGCTVPTDGMLVRNSTVFCAGRYLLPSGISIKDSFVELDCNGSVLDGGNNLLAYYGGLAAYKGSANGIKVGDTFLLTTDVKVKNCVVVNYMTGIFLDHSRLAELEGNEVFNTSVAIKSLWDQKSVVHDNDLHDNLHWGVNFQHSKNSEVYSNNIHDNLVSWTVPGTGPEPLPVSVCPGSGIALQGSSKGNIIRYNVIKHMCFNGVQLSGSVYPQNQPSENLIQDNDIADCYRYGIFFNYAKSNTVKHNTVKLVQNNLQSVFMGTAANGNRLWSNNLYMGASSAVLTTSHRNDPVDNGVSNRWCGRGVSPYAESALATIGNFYEDTSPGCVDANKDGICDVPRVISGSAHSVDCTPLKKPV